MVNILNNNEKLTPYVFYSRFLKEVAVDIQNNNDIHFKFVENESIVLDSEIPSRAIVTVKKIWATQAVSFAIEVQKARYLHAKDLNDDATYLSICENLKLDKEQFIEAFHSQAIKKETQETFALAQQYASSYPTLLIEKEGKLYILEQGFAPIEGVLKQIDTILN